MLLYLFAAYASSMTVTRSEKELAKHVRWHEGGDWIELYCGIVIAACATTCLTLISTG
jgi:hypothetical protein